MVTYATLMVEPSMVEKRVSFAYKDDTLIVEPYTKREEVVLVVTSLRFKELIHVLLPFSPIPSTYPCVTKELFGLYAVISRSTSFL